MDSSIASYHVRSETIAARCLLFCELPVTLMGWTLEGIVDPIAVPWPMRNIARFDKPPVGYVCGLQPKIIADRR